MNRASAVQSSASVQALEVARPTLSRLAPVFRSATSPGQVPEKFDASRSGLSLPTTPSTVCGAYAQWTKTPTVGSSIGPSLEIAWSGRVMKPSTK